MKRGLLLTVVALCACWEAPAAPPEYTFEATCNGVVTRFTATGLSDNDDPAETHRAFVSNPPTELGGYWSHTVVARFDPTCSIARVDAPARAK